MSKTEISAAIMCPVSDQAQPNMNCLECNYDTCISKLLEPLGALMYLISAHVYMCDSSGLTALYVAKPNCSGLQTMAHE